MQSILDRGMQVVLLVVTAMALCIGVGPAEAQGPPVYDVRVIDLRSGSRPADLNNRGEVVGGLYGKYVPPVLGFSAFYWFDGVLVDLGAEWENNTSSALSVNNSGVILGTVEGNGKELDRMYLVDAGGNISYPAPFDPAVNVRARAINDAGQIVGTYQLAPNSTSIPFFWDRTTTPYDLVPAWADRSLIGGLNNLGHVAGNAVEDGCGNSGFLWQTNYFTEFGPCSEKMSVNDINDASQIVGSMLFEGDDQPHAFLYEGSEFVDLGVLDGEQMSVANGINNRGWIVGDSSSVGPPSRRAFISINGRMYDLNDSLSDQSWHLTRALEINDRGQILMEANPTAGFGAAFLLLTPRVTYAIEVLIELVGSFELHHGIENGLVVKLEHAIEAIIAGDMEGACSLIRAFINQVSAQTGKKITEIEAQELLEIAEQIQGELACP